MAIKTAKMLIPPIHREVEIILTLHGHTYEIKQKYHRFLEEKPTKQACLREHMFTQSQLAKRLWQSGIVKSSALLGEIT